MSKRSLVSLAVFSAALPILWPSLASAWWDLCAKPGGGYGCYATLQEAIDAAGPNDTIQLKPGVFNENVTIPEGKDGLTIQGPKEAILDPDALDPEDPLSGIGILVESNRVTLKGFTIRNGQDDHVEISSETEGATMWGMTFIGATASSAACIDDDGDGLTVKQSYFFGCYYCIDSEGDGTTVRYNVFRHCEEDVADIDGDDAIFSNNDSRQFEYGPEITGNNAEVVDNYMETNYDNAFDIDGDDAYVAYNKIVGTYGEGIDLTGNRGVVKKNWIQGASDSGIYVDGDDAIVSYNCIEDAMDSEPAIDIDGDNPIATYNDISGAYYEGIEIDCDSCEGTKVSNNVLFSIGSGNEPGIYVSADGTAPVEVSWNSLYSITDDGLELTGDAPMTVTGNLVSGAGHEDDEHCFDVSGSGQKTLRDNTAIECGGDGINLDDGAHVIVGNVVKKARSDGIDAESSSADAEILWNRVYGSAGVGIEVSTDASGTVVRGNEIFGSAIDLCDEGTDTTLASNRFATSQIQSAADDCPIDD